VYPSSLEDELGLVADCALAETAVTLKRIAALNMHSAAHQSPRKTVHCRPRRSMNEPSHFREQTR
jgi:hypothetical protein